MNKEQSFHVVVLGGGFGGLTFCQTFNHPNARVTIVDHRNYHLFQPLLYQVATAGLSANEIAQPIRSILSQKTNLSVIMDEVIDIQLREKKVILKNSTLSYDYLVMALGGVTSYFGHSEWEAYAPGLKTVEDALRIRSEVLSAFEKAENTTDIAEQNKLMTIVVVGGGPTGVELAGAFAELARHVLKKDFRRIDLRQARIVLVEASSRLLGQLPPSLSESAQQRLEKMGIEVRLSCRVKSIESNQVVFDNETLPAANIIWAAGISATPLTRQLNVELDRAGRVKVKPDLSVPGYPEVFAIGDMAAVVWKTDQIVPGVSPAAMQMARHVSQIIDSEIRLGVLNRPARPEFKYWDKGTMATIGRSAAVAVIDGLRLKGFPAWIAWLGIHLIFLVGFRNKLAVLLQWSYSYLMYKRGARIIVGITEQKNKDFST